MNRQEYLKNYKKYHYSKTRKVISFPLLTEDFNALQLKAEAVNMKVSKLSKEIILNYIEKSPNHFITPQQEALIQSYIRISRGIANNINQIAYNTNIGELIDVTILINSLKRYEDEFRDLITKL